MARNNFRRFIKDIDIFGHPASLNFDRKGRTHQTCCGGLCTIVYLVIIFIVALFLFIGMMSNDRALKYSHEFNLDSSLLSENQKIGENVKVHMYLLAEN